MTAPGLSSSTCSDERRQCSRPRDSTSWTPATSGIRTTTRPAPPSGPSRRSTAPRRRTPSWPSSTPSARSMPGRSSARAAEAGAAAMPPAAPTGAIHFSPLPSWEAFFGAASELLYYTPHMKADFAPLLAGCIGTYEQLRRFFLTLYFGTVPEAVALLGLTDELRPLARVRSFAFEPAGAGRPCECARRRQAGQLLRRPGDLDITAAGRSRVPVRAAPVDRYLRARGPGPPRTWTASVAQRLRLAGGGAGERLADAALEWYAASVDQLLEDPKEGDTEGDYFDAWLRECHREIHDDVDTSDPAELRSAKWVESESSSRRYDLGAIRIPDYESAFQELRAFDFRSRSSTRRERVLAKILVDAFQLRLVDAAAILTIGNIVAQSEEGARVVVVLYAGAAHSRCVVEFFRSQGLGHQGLPKKGYVGQEEWEDDEPRGLELPSYLHDFSELFPVPKAQPPAARAGAAPPKASLQERRKAEDAADQAMRELLEEEAQAPGQAKPKAASRKQKR
ncbi:unnamed protein product [Prorocentrum cordatum]|uniref:Uncharacterized protein n=2 Tax=Prorocentrum cordatum TaxID=2364126 RepID=A0ABN9W7K8_9DINO|nr:unnamed protein product [Polarella glacialis]